MTATATDRAIEQASNILGDAAFLPSVTVEGRALLYNAYWHVTGCTDVPSRAQTLAGIKRIGS